MSVRLSHIASQVVFLCLSVCHKLNIVYLAYCNRCKISSGLINNLEFYFFNRSVLKQLVIFIINMYIGLNLFKCIHKITNVKIIFFLYKKTKKIFRGPSHQLSVPLFKLNLGPEFSMFRPGNSPYFRLIILKKKLVRAHNLGPKWSGRDFRIAVRF